jgi:hypothetical protein
VKEVYYKGDKQIVEYNFNSLSEYCEYLTNGVHNGRITSHLSSDAQGSEWSGTDSYEEAVQLCLYGDYSDRFNELLKLKDDLDESILEKKKIGKQVVSKVGYIPHIPNYLIGYPLQMINTEYTEFKNTEYITIYFNVSQLGTYTKQQFYHKGVICLSLIEHFESAGYKVILKLFAASYCKHQTILTYFNLKHENERLDIRNLFFPMTNVAFLRRMHFRLREITEELEGFWSENYGYSLTSKEIKSLLDTSTTSVVLSYPDELGISGANLIEDAKNCFKKLGLTDLL